jgi:hypothetical protein
MRRREFIRLIGGGAAAAWPPVARGQHTTVRRVGVGLAETDSAALQRRAALKHRLEVLGWVDGHNLDLAVRWSESKIDKAESQAKELVAWNADVLIAHELIPALALRKATTEHSNHLWRI